MGFIERLQQLIQQRKLGEDNPAALAQRAADLREQLAADPNNAAAFDELADIVRRAEVADEPADPLRDSGPDTTTEIPVVADADGSDAIAPTPTTPSSADAAAAHTRANLALWALAEEIGAQSRAWYPLIELARLAVRTDLDSAVRRIQTAIEREDSGEALARGVRVLREAGAPSTGLAVGLGHWSPGTQIFAAGKEIVLAAHQAGRDEEAQRLLNRFNEACGDECSDLVRELSALLDRAGKDHNGE